MRKRPIIHRLKILSSACLVPEASCTMESFSELNHEDKLAWLELFEAQDISAKEFCSNHEINYHQFLSWKRSRKPDPAEFIELECLANTQSKPTDGILAELELGNGTVLRVFNPNPIKA
jgi:hypothetical protein